MGLYTKTDKQIDIFYKVVSINKSLSKQIFFKSYSFNVSYFQCTYDYEVVSMNHSVMLFVSIVYVIVEWNI